MHVQCAYHESVMYVCMHVQCAYHESVMYVCMMYACAVCVPCVSDVYMFDVCMCSVRTMSQ